MRYSSRRGNHSFRKQGYTYRPHRRIGGRTRRARVLRRALIALCAAVALYCAVRLVIYGVASLQTARKNRELQSLYAVAAQSDTPAPSQTPSPAPSQSPAPTAYIPGAVTPIPRSQATLRPSYQSIAPSMLDGMRALYKRNNDLTGWLTIPGVVDLPVVYRDNAYYLNHDFDGKKNTAGTLFLDVHHPFNAKTQYLVIHGHNMNDGSMFGILAHYRKMISYVREHGLVSFSSLYKKETYVVFSVMVVPDSPEKAGYVPYLGMPVFYSAEQFYNFTDTLQAGSLYYIPIDVDASDALLTLSTCIGDDRLIVACRRVRADESEDALKRQLNKSVAR